MDIYQPVPTSHLTSLPRPTHRQRLLQLLNWYDLVAGLVTLAIVTLVVWPIVQHHSRLYLLWPIVYGLYVLARVTPGGSSRAWVAAREKAVSATRRLIKWAAAVHLLPVVYVSEDSWRPNRFVSFGMSLLLTAAAVIFTISVRRADEALQLSLENDGALWLLFVLPILRVARYGSLVSLAVQGIVAFLSVAFIHMMGDTAFTLTSARLIAIQCAWLVLISLLPAVLSRYLAETRSALEAAVAVVGQIAQLPYESEQDFFNRTAEIIQKQLGYTEVCILLPTFIETGAEQCKGLRLAGAATTLGRDFVEHGFGINMADGRGVTVAAALTGSPQVVNSVPRDLTQKKLYYPHPSPDFAPILSEMAFPILLNGELLGVLDIESDQAFAFSEDDATIMQAIVTHLAVALDDRQNLARTEGLYRTSRSITQHLFSRKSLRPMLQAIAEATRQELAASSVVIYAWDPIRQVYLEPVVDGVLRQRPASAAEVAASGGRSLVQQVMRWGEREVTGNASAEDAPRALWMAGEEQRRTFAELAGIRTAIAIPLRSGTTVDARSGAIGAIFINYEQVRLISDKQRRWCEALGDLASLALQNVWLNEQAADEERKDIWFEIHDGMVQDAWIMREAVADLAEVCQRKGFLSETESQDLGRVVWCSTSLHRQVNYLVDLWDETRRREAARRVYPPEDFCQEAGLFNELREYALIVKQAYEVECGCSCEGSDKEVSQDVQHACHMIIREAVRNAIRHGGASRIGIQLRATPTDLKLVVTDNGVGFHPERIRTPRGLKSIRKRARASGGEGDVRSTLGVGTTVDVSLPLMPERALVPQSVVPLPGASGALTSRRFHAVPRSFDS